VFLYRFSAFTRANSTDGELHVAFSVSAAPWFAARCFPICPYAPRCAVLCHVSYRLVGSYGSSLVSQQLPQNSGSPGGPVAVTPTTSSCRHGNAVSFCILLYLFIRPSVVLFVLDEPMAVESVRLDISCSDPFLCRCLSLRNVDHMFLDTV